MKSLFMRMAGLSRRARILLIAGGGVLAVIFIAGALVALNPRLMARLMRALPGLTIDGCEIEPGAQCRGADLHFTKLREADLEGTDLSEANLYWVDLSKAKLTGANLTSANLSNVDLSEADLTGANLTDAKLTNAELADAILTDAVQCRTLWPDGSTHNKNCKGR